MPEKEGLDIRFKLWGRKVKNASFGKPVKFLVDQGVNQHHITITRLLMLPLAILTAVFFEPLYGGIFFVVILLLDMIDGTIARIRGDPSDRGKFSDMVVDYAIYVSMIVLLMYWGAVWKVIAGYVLAVAPITYILAVVAKNEGKESDWIIEPFANQILFIVLVCAAFLTYAFLGHIEFFGHSITTHAFILLSATMTFHGIRFFFVLQDRWFFKK